MRERMKVKQDMCTECTGDSLPSSEEIAGALSRLIESVYAEGESKGGPERGAVEVEDLFFEWLVPWITIIERYYDLDESPDRDVETMFEIARTSFNKACLTTVLDNPPVIKYSAENIKIIFFSRREL